MKNLRFALHIIIIITATITVITIRLPVSISSYIFLCLYPSRTLDKNSYRCSGYRIVKTQSSITYTLRLLELSEADKQQMQSNFQYIPCPQLRDRSTYQFSVPSDFEIRHIQLLTKKRCLLILDDGKRNLDVYLETLETLSNAVQNERDKKHIHGERLRQNAVIAYDETKRTLVVCTSGVHNSNVS